jgi:hypothetical protein
LKCLNSSIKNRIIINNELKTNTLLISITELIEQSKQQVVIAVNSTMSSLYWKIGQHINEEILENSRAEYGKQVVQSLSAQLEQEYAKGWGEKQLRHCMQFAAVFTDEQIVYTLCRQLSWSHIRLVMFMEDKLKRDFYIEICKLEKWSVRVFQERI